ncbi:MAG: Rieske 2Fe-2S domain-containing protein [Acidobacteria bacterium]|nr:Rieske 2Fe-2S domain-containing protein [Acidobacteriota bacterium]
MPCERRTFLQAACFTLSAAALGLNAADSATLPVAEGDGQQSGNEVRLPLLASDGVTIDRKVQVIIVRYQSHVYAFNLACPHENNVLKWLPKDGRFQCTKHDSQYTPVGVYTSGRATRNMDRLGVRKEENTLVVDLNKFYQSDKNAAGWAAAVVTL